MKKFSSGVRSLWAALYCPVTSFPRWKKEINLVWELSLSSWIFAVTSGGTSRSGGYLEQQIEFLKKVCVRWHWLPVGILLWVHVCVRGGNLKTQPRSAVFAFCSVWMMPVPSKSCSSVSIGTCRLQSFHARRMYRTFITPYTQRRNSQQSVAYFTASKARLRPVMKTKSHRHNVL